MKTLYSIQLCTILSIFAASSLRADITDDLPTGDVVITGDGSYPLSNFNEVVQKLSSIDLEQTQNFQFDLSGQTSIHLKFKQASGVNGTFVTRNSAANPNTEVAYFNLASVLGVDQVFRAGVPYTLGPNAIAVYKRLIEDGSFSGIRAQNKQTILAAMNEDPDDMKGCIKEKKIGDEVALDSLCDVENNRPALGNQLFIDLNAANPKPTADGKYQFHEGYWGPRAKLAHQYSLMMTMDAVFGQWDRYSGQNVVFRIVDKTTKEIEVYSTDNGGADFWNTTKWTQKQVSWFSRYDRNAIENLKAVYSFLTGKATSLTSVRLNKKWTDPKVFVVDMGLYYELSPASYVKQVAANIGVLLQAVNANYNRYGDAIFF